MLTSIRIFAQQLLRGKKRLTLNIALLITTTAFFVMSLNLYRNSNQNLLLVEESYSTIAAAEIYGDVNSAGELVMPGSEGYMGYHLLNAVGFDLSPLLKPDCVTGYDLRWRCGAYIPGKMPTYLEEAPEDSDIPVNQNKMFLVQRNDVVRFRILEDEPQTLPLAVNTSGWRENFYLTLDIEVIDQSRKELHYSKTVSLSFNEWYDQADADWYAEDIRRLNRSDSVEGITLYPGVEYVASVQLSDCYWRKDSSDGLYYWVDGRNAETSHLELCLQFNEYDDRRKQELYDEEGGETGSYFTGPTAQQPFFLHRWEDVQANAEEAAYWQAAWDAAAITGNSFMVTLTNDITQVPAWHLGGMYLHSGRMITEEEYAAGAKVCMLSKRMADYLGVTLGDTLDMRLFTYSGAYDSTGTGRFYGPQYTENADGFFDQGVFEIVGLIGQHEIIGTSEVTPQILYQPWNTIYAPINAAPNAPAQETWDVHPSLLTLKLKNGTIDQFQTAMDELGLTDSTPGEYRVIFSCFDQGYSIIHAGLVRMRSISQILLILSTVLMLATLVLVAYFFAQQQKHSTGILRMLGGTKVQVLAGIFACALTLCLVSTVFGGLLGGILGQTVGGNILNANAEWMEPDEFSPDLLNARSTNDATISVGSDPVLTLLGTAGCLLLFLFLLSLFISTYIRQEPRELLSERRG